MIPYFNFSTFHLGPLTIHTWGLFVSTGIAVALIVAYRRAKRLGLDGNKILDLIFWILVAAFVGARLFHVFFYEWSYFRAHLLEIVRIDQGGLSSFGGFIGAALAFWWYRKKVCHPERSEGSRATRESRDSSASPQNDRLLWRYADVLMFAWPLGHGIARIGCFLTHMHPGRLSNAWWAVQYPGDARLDMGLVESAVLLSYWIIVWVTVSHRPSPDPRSPAPLRRGRGEGFYLVSGMIFYGTLRFVLDFFRATDILMADARYAGLTPAQYGSIGLIGGGLMLWKVIHNPALAKI